MNHVTSLNTIRLTAAPSLRLTLDRSGLSATFATAKAGLLGAASLDPRVRLVEAIMVRNLGQRLSLAELARRTGVSVSRLAHLFKNQIGVSPRQYLKSLRLRHARSLLEIPSLSVKEVAGQVGLTTGALIKQFRRAYGVPPGRHRRGLRAFNKEAAAGFREAAADHDRSRIGL